VLAGQLFAGPTVSRSGEACQLANCSKNLLLLLFLLPLLLNKGSCHCISWTNPLPHTLQSWVRQSGFNRWLLLAAPSGPRMPGLVDPLKVMRSVVLALLACCSVLLHGRFEFYDTFVAQILDNVTFEGYKYTQYNPDDPDDWWNHQSPHAIRCATWMMTVSLTQGCGLQSISTIHMPTFQTGATACLSFLCSLPSSPMCVDACCWMRTGQE